MKLPLQKPSRVLGKSWMANPDQVKRIDGNVRVRLATARKNENLPPREPAHSVDLLVEHIHRGVRYRRWFVTTTACALLGELIYASGGGRIYNVPDKVPAPLRRDRKIENLYSLHRPLEILRNACVHPAQVVGKGEDGPAMERLVEAVRKTAGGGPLATLLEASWVRLHDDALAAWALERIDYAGRYELGQPEAVPDRR